MISKKKIYTPNRKPSGHGIFNQDFVSAIEKCMFRDQYGFYHSSDKVITLDVSVPKPYNLVQGWDFGNGNILSGNRKIIECACSFQADERMLYVSYTYPHDGRHRNTSEIYDIYLYCIMLDKNSEELFYDEQRNIFDFYSPTKIFSAGVNGHLSFMEINCRLFLCWDHKSSFSSQSEMTYKYDIKENSIIPGNAVNNIYNRTIDAVIDSSGDDITYYNHPVNPDFYIAVISPCGPLEPDNKTPAIVMCLGGPNIGIPQFNEPDSIYRKFSEKGFYIIVPLRRGIMGISKEWENGIAGNYGIKDVDDIINGTQFVISILAHKIDSSRIGIYGASYGGYTALMSIGKSNMFKAAVSHCGMSDLVNYPRECSGNEADVMETYAGTDVIQEFSKIAKVISPISHIKCWKTPVLLVHSIDDESVWFGQSVRTYNECVRLGKEAGLILVPGPHSYDIIHKDKLMDIIMFFYLSKLSV